jgi:hypothetical protein
MEGGLIDLRPGMDPRLGFVDHTGQAAILNFRNGAFSVGGFAFDVVNDEMNRLASAAAATASSVGTGASTSRRCSW